MIDRRMLKANAKARLAQTGGEYLKVMLLYALAAEVVPTVLTTASSTSQEVTNQLSQLVSSGIDLNRALELLQISSSRLALQSMLSVVLSIYRMVLSFGLAVYALCLYRGRECGAPELFSGFSMAGRVVGQRVILLGLYMLWAIVLSFPLTGVFVFGAMSGAIGGLVALAGIVAYVAAVMVIMLRYELATLALADRPELRIMESIRYARALIQGHIGQYFVLLLSFAGWSILCVLPSVIFSFVFADAAVSSWVISAGTVLLSLPVYLWLAPYMNTTTAGFYDALQEERG